jgi:hypothetical protein
MRFQVARVNHDRPLLATVGNQSFRCPSEDTRVAPLLPEAEKVFSAGHARLGAHYNNATRSHKLDYADQDAPIIDVRFATALGKKQLQSIYLLVSQLKENAHHHPRRFRSFNHDCLKASS